MEGKGEFTIQISAAASILIHVNFWEQHFFETLYFKKQAKEICLQKEGTAVRREAVPHFQQYFHVIPKYLAQSTRLKKCHHWWQMVLLIPVCSSLLMLDVIWLQTQRLHFFQMSKLYIIFHCPYFSLLTNIIVMSKQPDYSVSKWIPSPPFQPSSTWKCPVLSAKTASPPPLVLPASNT